METHYKKKYLKYKNKYLSKTKGSKHWSNQRGGEDKDKDLQPTIPDTKLAINETYFWGKQFQEHMEIFYLAIEENTLKDTGKELKEKWGDFLDKEFVDKGIVYEKARLDDPDSVKVFLDESDFEKIGELGRFDFDGLTNLLRETRNYKDTVHKKLDSGEWIGWLYPSLAEHVILELDMFYKRITGKLTPEDDIAFFVKMSKDHITVAGKLTDPSTQNESIEHKMWQIRNNAPKDINVDNALNYVNEVKIASEELQKIIHAKTFLGIIPPDLADHDQREQVYATKKIMMLLKN